MAQNTKTTESKTTKKKSVVKKNATKSAATKTGGSKKNASKTAKVEKVSTKKATKVKAKKTTAKKVTKTSKAKKVKKQTKKSAEKKSTVQKKELSGGNSSRYFKVKYENNSPTGRFSGTKPKQAANKALTSILKLREGAGKSTKVQVRFSIVECTRGSKHKEYSYVGERVELAKPMEVKIGKGPNAKTIKYRYNNKVFKDKVDSK